MTITTAKLIRATGLAAAAAGAIFIAVQINHPPTHSYLRFPRFVGHLP